MKKNNFAITTFTGQTHFCSEIEAKNIMNMGSGQKFFLEKKMIKTNDVANILPIEEYYKQNPDKRPTYTPDLTKKLGARKIFKKTQRIETIKLMKKHYIKGVEETWGSIDKPQHQAFLQKLDDRIKELEKNIVDNSKQD